LLDFYEKNSHGLDIVLAPELIFFRVFIHLAPILRGWGLIAQKEEQMRLRRYEIVIMLPPDLEDVTRREILARLDGVIEGAEGILIKREDWGNRKLAYEVKRYSKGHYYLMDFAGSTAIVPELERHIKMMEKVLRFLTVKKDDRVDVEAVKKEQSEEREKEAAREAAMQKQIAEEEERMAIEAAKKENDLEKDVVVEPPEEIAEPPESEEIPEPVQEPEQVEDDNPDDDEPESEGDEGEEEKPDQAEDDNPEDDEPGPEEDEGEEKKPD